MRTFRLPLGGSVILAMLASLSITVTAQDQDETPPAATIVAAVVATLAL